MRPPTAWISRLTRGASITDVPAHIALWKPRGILLAHALRVTPRMWLRCRLPSMGRWVLGAACLVEVTCVVCRASTDLIHHFVSSRHGAVAADPDRVAVTVEADQRPGQSQEAS